MMSDLDNLSNIERQEQIVQLLSRQKRVTVNDLCDAFSISKATARRDLEILASQGRIQRVHGGAILVTKAPPELPILERQNEQANEKERIGAATAALINDKETVFLGSGTTVLEVARNLIDRPLTVITNSLPVINLFASSKSPVEVIVLGGELRKSELSFIGHITEQNLSEVYVDKVIIGVRAINLEQGLTNDYFPETNTDRAIIKMGKEVILVADHTKFGRVSTVLLAPLTSVQTVVSDEFLPDEYVRQLKELGIRLILA
ncbi:MAG: Transcriptional repressor of the fructose operon, DeoR family [Anaerolineae bacterium]|jgi:DeoR/GlpR family transcriptional regulator of sugar metabolism|nr:MAG: Transcriptional repressor of the fructose operon, DeoR family [Anaerolineae bacterium]